MDNNLEKKFKEKELVLKRLYENKQYNKISSIIENEILLQEIKNLNINQYYLCNIEKTMENFQNNIKRIIFNDKSNDYSNVIKHIIKFLNNKLNHLKNIYSVTSKTCEYYSSETTQKQISFIDKKMDFINENMPVSDSFMELEQIVLKDISNGKNPFHIVSLKYPLDAIIITVERIYDVVQNKIYTNELKKENSKKLLYLNNIILIKKATYVLPSNLRSLYFKLATYRLSTLISKGKEVSISDIEEFLRKITKKETDEILYNSNNRLISQSTIEKYYSDDEDEMIIAKYYYGEVDKDFNPKLDTVFNKQFGPDKLNDLKEKIANDIISMKK